jgi:hypothetical protein
MWMDRTRAKNTKSSPENWWNVIFETKKFSNNGIPSRDKTKDNLSTGIIVSKKFSHTVTMFSE